MYDCVRLWAHRSALKEDTPLSSLHLALRRMTALKRLRVFQCRQGLPINLQNTMSLHSESPPLNIAKREGPHADAPTSTSSGRVSPLGAPVRARDVPRARARACGRARRLGAGVGIAVRARVPEEGEDEEDGEREHREQGAAAGRRGGVARARAEDGAGQRGRRHARTQ